MHLSNRIPQSVILQRLLGQTKQARIHAKTLHTTNPQQITLQRLLDQSQAGVYMGKTPHTPHFGPFWAYSRTLPQGVELLV